MTQMYKMLRADLKHYGFQYKEGLNVDTLPFHPYGECNPGGLYYTSLHYLGEHFNPDWTLIADVTVPDDAEVYPEPCGTKWKADRLVLSNIRPLSEFFKGMDEDVFTKLFLQASWWATLVSMIPHDARKLRETVLKIWPGSIHYFSADITNSADVK